MDARTTIIDAFERLVLQGDVDPSWDEVAEQSHLSRNGVLYHFPKRRLLHAAVTARARDASVAHYAQAQAQGRLARAVLEWRAALVPQPNCVVAHIALYQAGQLEHPLFDDTYLAISDGLERAMAEELANEAAANLIRLSSDGLLLARLAGKSVTAGQVEQILRTALTAQPL